MSARPQCRADGRERARRRLQVGEFQRRQILGERTAAGQRGDRRTCACVERRNGRSHGRRGRGVCPRVRESPRAPQLFDGGVAALQARSQREFGAKQRTQIRGAGRTPGIVDDVQWPRDSHCRRRSGSTVVRSRQHQRTDRLLARRSCPAIAGRDDAVRDGIRRVALAAVVERRRRRIAEIPDEAMETRRGRHDLRRREPVLGHVRHPRVVPAAGVLVNSRTSAPVASRMAIVTPSGRGLTKRVVEDRAVRRVLAGQHLGRQRRVLILVPSHSRRVAPARTGEPARASARPSSICRSGETSSRIHSPRPQVAITRSVPCTAMSLTAMRGRFELQRLPAAAAIERDEHSRPVCRRRADPGVPDPPGRRAWARRRAVRYRSPATCAPKSRVMRRHGACAVGEIDRPDVRDAGVVRRRLDRPDRERRLRAEAAAARRCVHVFPRSRVT